MPEDITLHASARVALTNPSGMLDRLCDHFVDHGRVTRATGSARLDGAFGAVELTLEPAALAIAVVAPNESYLFVVKSSIAEHLVEFADGPFGLGDVLGMGLEHVPRLALGRGNGAVQFTLSGGVEAELSQLAKQLGFALLDLGDPLGRAGEAAGDFVFLAPNVAHRLFEAGQGLGSAYAHRLTTGSQRRP